MTSPTSARIPQNVEMVVMSGTLSSAMAALRAGKLYEAQSVCHQVLANDPSNADALNLLGIIASTAGHHEAGAELMRRSVALAPQVVEFRKNLVRALIHERKLAEAEDVLREAMVQQPDSPDLLALWGSVVGQKGDLIAGIESLKKAIAGSPAEVNYRFNLAELYRRNHDRASAIATLKDALELVPEHADTLNNLAGLQLEEGRFLEALATIQRLLKVDPRSARAYCNLASLLRAVGDSRAAVTALRNALTLDPALSRARFQLANSLIDEGELDEAEVLIRDLRLTERSNSLALKATHAKILERKGDIHGAAEIIESIDPDQLRRPDMALMQAIIQDQLGKKEEAVLTLKQALASGDLAAVEGTGIHFVLGQLCDSLGRYDEAFEAYRTGNENRKKAFIQFDSKNESPETPSQRVISLYDPEHYRSCPVSNLDSELPIFIIGMPRSGTSLTEQILANHSRVYGGGELTKLYDSIRATYAGDTQQQSPLEIIVSDPSDGQQCVLPKGWSTITSEQLTALGTIYLDFVRQLGGDAARVTDKMPYNFFLAPLIPKLFPRARIVHCVRNPIDTCLSCYFQNFTAGNRYAYDLVELGAFYRDYLKVMSVWRETLAVPMLDVEYERLVSDPEPVVRQMLDYCGLEWEANCLKFHQSSRAINTASYQQVRKPIYTKSVARWKRYSKHIGPLIEALGIPQEQLE